jgi:lysophospholipase L1-like esterase
MSIRIRARNRSPLAAASLLVILATGPARAAVLGNPILSRGLVVYGSPASNLPSLNDGSYGSGWAVGANTWAAYHLPKTTSNVVVAWNNPSYTWSDLLTDQPTNHSGCVQGTALTYPTDYQILTSSNSTNGSDGVWTSRVTVTDNQVSSRSHLVTTAGDAWVKLSISAGTGNLDEFDVFDASDSLSDTWMFIGTSISANAYKGTPPVTDFQKLVESSTGTTPVVVKAGIPCIYSSDVSKNIGGYLSYGRYSRYWAIEMGTNDAWGGGTAGLAVFKTALQLVIDSAKGRHIQPMIARVLATNPAAMTSSPWQVNQAFLAAIDSLTAKNGLVPGPDLYTYFLAHPTELNSDGVHPNATGAASIQRLWAEAMIAAVYSSTTSLAAKSRSVFPMTLSPRDGGFAVSCGSRGCGGLSLNALDGRRVDLGRRDFVPKDAAPPGLYVLRSSGPSGSGEAKILLGW